MKGHWRSLICIVALTLAALLVYFYHIHFHHVLHSQAEQQLAAVESQINECYRAYRPFPYRWSGAPYSPLSPGMHQIPEKQLRLLLGQIERVERSFGRNARSIKLKARINLVGGKYDTALHAYHLAALLAPDDSNVHLEIGIAFALRAKAEGRALDYEHSLETILQAEQHSHTSEILFDVALLFEEVPLPQQAVEQWQTVISTEPSSKWQWEAERRLARLRPWLQRRADRVHGLTMSPTSYLKHTNDVQGAEELVAETALENWLPVANSLADARTALTHLAEKLKAEHHDEWLIDLLKTRHSRDAVAALQALSESLKANSKGNHVRAEKLATIAERLFRRLHNPAGILRSRLERAYSLDRRWRPEACMSAIVDVRSAAHDRHYVWIEGQSWLEEITCRTETRKAEVIASREQAYQWISTTGYEDLRLRSLSFLTEGYGGADNQLKIWRLGRDGLRSFWDELLPARRGYTLYYTLADCARSRGNQQAALVLLQEGVSTLESSPYKQLFALVLSYLGARRLEAHLDHEADETFDRMETLFRNLPPKETEKFYRLAQVVRAEAELKARKAVDALNRLQFITQRMSFPYKNFGATERRQLLPVLGDAYLAEGKFDKALQCYHQIILENRRDIGSIRDHRQRDAAQREIGAAWRGTTEILLRRHKFAQALDNWEAFRSGRLSDPYPIRVRPPSGIVFLTYAILPGGLSGWFADSHGVHQRWLDESQVKLSAERFSTLVADPESPAGVVKDISQSLYRTLIQPFIAELPPSGLIVVDPDSLLAAIPWAALQDEHNRFLLERFAISQAVGWREVQSHLDQKKVDFSKSLILGAPDLGAEVDAEYGSQIDSLHDARMLHKLIPTAVYHEGKDVTLETLRRSAPKSTMLYFAGHGISHGGFGALLVSPSNRDTGPIAIITAEELAHLRLDRLQLVVLAACSSGTGEQLGAIDLESLVRGFLEAGAFRVIAARWNVNSQGTTEMMLTLHKLLLAGKRPAEALQIAAVMTQRNSPKSAPFFWAGFQVFGTP
jgi:CHAT domain-containing protein/tetratricopeptide (TPR) repeat protein